MLTTIATIALHWPAAALNFDDTAYATFINHEDMYVKRRLINWVGQEAYNDAMLEIPADPTRAQALKDAEIQLFHISCLHKLWRDAGMGKVKTATLPSGMSVTLSTISESEFKTLIQHYLDEAYRMVEDYICY